MSESSSTCACKHEEFFHIGVYGEGPCTLCDCAKFRQVHDAPVERTSFADSPKFRIQTLRDRLENVVALELGVYARCVSEKGWPVTAEYEAERLARLAATVANIAADLKVIEDGLRWV